MEETLEHGLCSRRGRTFIDLWDIERFYECKDCDPLRAERLRGMNLSQTVPPRVECRCEAPP